MTLEEQDPLIAKAKELLAQHGFKLSVNGCGCCGSPWVRLEHRGQPIIDAGEDRSDRTVSDCCFDMFEEAKP
jgi:hypothetical protein